MFLIIHSGIKTLLHTFHTGGGYMNFCKYCNFLAFKTINEKIRIFTDYLVVERRDTGDGVHFYTTPANRNDGYNTLYTTSTVAGFDGTWGHLVLTNDSSQPAHLQKQMYVNGVLFTTGVQNVGSSVSFATGPRDNYWVGRNGFGTLYENGVENLKIFRVYNRILTAQEAATLYENRDGASGSSDVTNYRLVSNNADGTETKWEPVSGGGTTSDDRIKSNEKPITQGVSVIEQLQPKIYDKHQNHRVPADKEDNDLTGVDFVTESGFVAQDVDKIEELKHLVHYNVLQDLYSLNYTGIIPYLVQSIKELNARIKVLESK